MARIDFSNASIECLYPQMFNSVAIDYLGMGENNFISMLDSSNAMSISNGKTNITNVTSNGFTIIKSGTVTGSGNKIVLRKGNTAIWAVTGITFNNGDTFDFQIDVRINTT